MLGINRGPERQHVTRRLEEARLPPQQSNSLISAASPKASASQTCDIFVAQ
jgi:hypothetical protein